MKRFVVTAIAAVFCALASAQAPDLSKMDLVERSTPDGPVAMVDGLPISHEEFLGLYRVQMAQLVGMAGGVGKVTDQMRLETAIQCVRRLIRERILLSEARKRGINVSDAEVQAEYTRQFTQMQKDYQEQTKQTLTEQQFLEKIGKTRDEVLQDAKQGMLIERTRDALLKGANTTVPDADVKTFYEKNPETFSRPGGVHLKQIFIRPEGGAQAGPKAWEAAEKAANKALARIRAGETFEAVAREVSNSADAANGGHIMVAGVDKLPPFYQGPLKAMKPGELSNIIKSEHGYHFFYYVESKEEEKVSLADAEDRIRGMLTRIKEEDHIDDILRPIELDPERVLVYLDFEKNFSPELRRATAGATN
jgi:parvulin-like peptidyl-prolyl isomerase